MDIKQESIEKHAQLQGKIEVTSKGKVADHHDLSVYYTPGVGAVSSEVAEHPDRAKDLTIAGNTIAVVSDGTAVLGLGDIGPQGALPVMEGKAMLFKELANVNAFPIVLDVTPLMKSLTPSRPLRQVLQVSTLKTLQPRSALMSKIA